jgi:hypothetical protein
VYTTTVRELAYLPVGFNKSSGALIGNVECNDAQSRRFGDADVTRVAGRSYRRSRAVEGPSA